jgi:CheY-like chemotaxis protein
VSNLALVIEDDPDLSTIFSEALTAAQFEPEIIRDGALALERLAVTLPSVVVLDLHLPNVSGAEILDKIRADSRLAKTRVILATADARMAEALQKKDQADLVLVKPVSFGQLRDLANRMRATMAQG